MIVRRFVSSYLVALVSIIGTVSACFADWDRVAVYKGYFVPSSNSKRSVCQFELDIYYGLKDGRVLYQQPGRRSEYIGKESGLGLLRFSKCFDGKDKLFSIEKANVNTSDAVLRDTQLLQPREFQYIQHSVFQGRQHIFISDQHDPQLVTWNVTDPIPEQTIHGFLDSVITVYDGNERVSGKLVANTVEVESFRHP